MALGIPGSSARMVVSGVLLIALSCAAALLLLLLLLPIRQGASPEAAIPAAPSLVDSNGFSKPSLRRAERRRTSDEERDSNRSVSLIFVPSKLQSSSLGSANDGLHSSEPSEEERSLSRSLSLYHVPPRAGSPLPDSTDDEPRTFKLSQPGACLQFIHIPKTAGTMMENIYEGHQKELDPRVSGWGKHNVEAKCLGETGRRCPVSGKTTCNKFHTPPMHDPLLWKTAYQMCDTFCVVRHPVDRFVSEWQYRTSSERKKCAPEKFLPWARAKLKFLEEDHMFMDDCHLLPQTQYVYRHDPGKAAVRTCRHILRYERLAEDFAQLMKAYNYSLAIAPSKANGRPVCELELPKDILARLRLIYSSDFGMFGYT